MGTQQRSWNRDKLKQFSFGRLFAPRSAVVYVGQGSQQQQLQEDQFKDQQEGKKGVRRYGLINDDENEDIKQDVDMDVDNEDYEHLNKKQKISIVSVEQQSLQVHQEYCKAKIERLTIEWNNHFQMQQNQIQQMEQSLAYQFRMEMIQQQQKILAISSENDKEAEKEYMLLQEKLKERYRQDEQRRQNLIKTLAEQDLKAQEEQQRLLREKQLKEEEEKQKKLEQERQVQLQLKLKQEEDERKKKELERQQAEIKKKIDQPKKVEQPKIVRPKFVSETMQQKVSDSIVLIAQKSALDEDAKGAEFLSQIREQIKKWSSQGTSYSREKSRISKKMTSEVSQISATTQQVQRKSVDLLRDIASYTGPARICVYYQIASKIILQCESQVARLPTFVFPLAEVACTLGVSHPDFLQILLALLREKCILVVPKYMVLVKQDADSNTKKDFLLRLGYLTKRVGLEEQMESSDEYIDRMKGYMRLYGALMQASNKENRYGIDNAWRWLARALNSTPPSRALAVSVFSILQVTGYALNQKYRSQFQKLLLVIQEQLVPKLQAKHDNDLNAIIVNIRTFCSSRDYQRPPKGKNMPMRDESQVLKA